jgi:hypothetical protein
MYSIIHILHWYIVQDGDTNNAYKILADKTLRKRQITKLDYINIDPLKLGFENTRWM